MGTPMGKHTIEIGLVRMESKYCCYVLSALVTTFDAARKLRHCNVRSGLGLKCVDINLEAHQLLLH